MSINVQRSGHLSVPQQPGNRGHIRPAGDHQTGRRVPQAVDVQVQGQAVFFEDQLEPPSKGAGGHGQISSVAAEDVVLYGQFSALVEFQFPLAEGTILFQQACHLQGKVDVPIPGRSLRFLHDDVLSRDLHHVAADVDGLLGKVHVLPFQAAAFPTAHPRSDDEFKVMSTE